MLFTTLAIAALGASSTLATPLLGALWGGKPDVRTKDGALPHLNSRDVNKVGKAELPTVSVLVSYLLACLISRSTVSP